MLQGLPGSTCSRRPRSSRKQLASCVSGTDVRVLLCVVLSVHAARFSQFVFPVSGTLASALIPGASHDTQAYINVHTAAYPGGEVRGQLAGRLSLEAVSYISAAC